MAIISLSPVNKKLHRPVLRFNRENYSQLYCGSRKAGLFLTNVSIFSNSLHSHK